MALEKKKRAKNKEKLCGRSLKQTFSAACCAGLLCTRSLFLTLGDGSKRRFVDSDGRPVKNAKALFKEESERSTDGSREKNHLFLAPVDRIHSGRHESR